MRMPAEWEPHEATWLAWPWGDESFAGRIPAVEAAFTAIVRALAPRERVKLIVRPGTTLLPLPVERIEADYVDVWTRDWGPTFLTGRAYVKWDFNAYDMRFPDTLKDGEVFNGNLLPEFERIRAGFTMEGGAIEVNGAGTALVTEETLIRGNRNPGVNKEEYEKKFKELLGVTQVVWLPNGLINDHTDGHVDEVARFVSADTIVYAWEDEGENHERLNENLKILKQTNFKLVPLPLPKMFYDNNESPNYTAGARAPASYCNFYIGNGVVLAPTFGDPADAEAQKILQEAFPDREVIGIPSQDLIYGGGGIHCVTQQEPKS